MKPLDLVVLMVCLQVGVLVVGLIEITPGQYLSTGEMNSIYAGGLTNTASSFQKILNLTNTVGSNWVSSQPMQFCAPIVNCFTIAELPSIPILNIIPLGIGAVISLVQSVTGLIYYSILLPGNFYTAILLSIVPGVTPGAVQILNATAILGPIAGLAAVAIINPNSTTILIIFIGESLGVIQSIILILEVIKIVFPGGGGK